MSSKSKKAPQALVTIDVEWCDNIMGCRAVQDSHELECMRLGLTRFLDVCEEYDIAGIMFTTGETAPLVSDLLQRAIGSGFIVGNHSFAHKSIAEMSIKEFSEDLRRSTQSIEDVTGEKVSYFRAPSFSMPINLNYYSVLKQEGYEVDSSIPLGGHASGVKAEIKDLLSIHKATGLSLVPVVGLGDKGRVFPGGGYYRLFPNDHLLKLLRHSTSPLPNVIYLHPRDLLGMYFPRNAMSARKFVKASISPISPVRKLRHLFGNLSFLTPAQSIALAVEATQLLAKRSL